MKSSILFRYHLFRNIFIPKASFDAPSIELLSASGEVGSTIDATDETSALTWLKSRQELLPLLLGQLGFHGRVCFDIGVTHPFLRRNREGDIDLLAVAEKDPRRAIAVQATLSDEEIKLCLVRRN